MNELANKGVKFANYYTQPSCSPSRSTIMTGKFVHKTGFQSLEIMASTPLGASFREVRVAGAAPCRVGTAGAWRLLLVTAESVSTAVLCAPCRQRGGWWLTESPLPCPCSWSCGAGKAFL